MRIIFAAASAALMASGCASPGPRPEIAQRVEVVTAERAEEFVLGLTAVGPRPSSDAEASRRSVEWIVDSLRAMGYAPRLAAFRATTRVRSIGDDGAVVLSGEEREHVNVVLELPGETEPDHVLEIGAHYDTVGGTVGADDNASAVAGLLEIARGLRGVRTQRTLRLCFFAMEEVGLVGSRAWVREVEAESAAGRRHAGILVLEMIGYTSAEPDSQHSPVRIPLLLNPPRTGDFIAVVGNLRSGALGNRFEDAAAAYVPGLRVYSLNRIGSWFGDAARSDHFSYWEAGLDGVMLTDTANFRNPHYHDAGDTPQTLDYGFLRDVSRAALGAALDWAGVIE